MNKSKIRRIRKHIREKQVIQEKENKIEAEKKAWLALRKKQRKQGTEQRSKKFFDDYHNSWQSQRNLNNLATPSVISNEWGKCTKKKSPLDDY